MSRSEGNESPTRVRREPPRFRRLEVQDVAPVGAWMTRLTLAGAELEGLTVEDPAASVRMLLPAPGTPELTMPVWNGNEFLLPNGQRAIIRTLTPYRVDADACTLELWVVLHDRGAASEWAARATAGDPTAISGPGRGYTIALDAPGFLVAGDETAIPAICQLLEVLPAETPVEVLIEVAHPDARLALPAHPRATVTWCDLPSGVPPGDALVDAVLRADIGPGARIWAAGEAASVQRIRKHLFEDREIPRTQATVRGYWKHGRRGDEDA